MTHAFYVNLQSHATHTEKEVRYSDGVKATRMFILWLVDTIIDNLGTTGGTTDIALYLDNGVIAHVTIFGGCAYVKSPNRELERLIRKISTDVLESTGMEGWTVF